MDAKTQKEFDSLRHKILEEQRTCGWCDKQFTSVDELVKHLMAEHPRKEL